MHRPSLARTVASIVRHRFANLLEAMHAAHTRREVQQVMDEMEARIPRNRAEARRLSATGGRIARLGGGGTQSPLLSLHRRIERDQRRQEERFLQGRHVWG